MLNAHLKSLAAIWQLLATKTQLACWVSEEDILHFHQRVEREGLSFLTTCLPRLDKALLHSIECGELVPITGFASKSNSPLPRFLGRAWDAIFERSGILRPINEIPSEAVLAVRQLSAVFYKLDVPYTMEQTEAVATAFIEAEHDLNQLALPDVPALRLARLLLRRLLAGIDPTDIQPKHGSGASACRVVPHKRYDTFRFIPRLHEVFPYGSYFYASPQHYFDESHRIEGAEVVENPPARVCFVPKDSRGPRLISCEPKEFMYIQQGLMAKLYRTVLRHPAINDMVGFTDQVRNQELARKASIDGSMATLDLKEASDRVSWKLVEYLFPENWVRAFWACRSDRTILPDGREVIMQKFAPMGSAVCFPVEALCFWSIALSVALLRLRKEKSEHEYHYVRRLFRNTLTSTDVRVSVFGDDIIVPVGITDEVIEALESVGLKINLSKSYRYGSFRESCGGDYFNGSNVTPIRWKHLPSDDMASKFRTCQMFNNIIGRYGYGKVGLAVQLLFESWHGPVVVSNRFGYRDGCMEQFGNGLCLYGPVTDVPSSIRVRYNRALFRREARVPVRCPVHHEVDLDRWSEVLRWFMNHDPQQSLARVALAKRQRYKYGWIAL